VVVDIYGSLTMLMIKTTETDSNYSGLDTMSFAEIFEHMNAEDQTVPLAVQKALPQVLALAEACSKIMKSGGRLFYIGAGTSGRLGILDASEIPPTFGVESDKVIGLIAGGDGAIRKAVEFAEDDTEQAWKDLLAYNIDQGDALIGIAASGTTPYVLGGVKVAAQNGLVTGCIVCNAGSPLASSVRHAVEVIVGPEFLTGSTRLKSGTAQKLVLNMLSTSLMIKLGRVKGNKMVDMKMSNTKLVERGLRMIHDETGLSMPAAKQLLDKHKGVRAAIDAYKEEQENKQDHA